MREISSRPFIKALLLVFCVLVVRGSPASRGGKDFKWFENNFKRFGGNEHGIGERARTFEADSNGLTDDEAEQLTLDRAEREFHSNSLRRNARGPYYFVNRLDWKAKRHETSDYGEKRLKRNKIPGIDDSVETQQRNLLSGVLSGVKKDEEILRSDSSSLYRWPDSTKDKANANPDDLLSDRRRSYKKMASNHRIVKRNANTSEPVQPSGVPSTNPPVLTLASFPPPFLPTIVPPRPSQAPVTDSPGIDPATNPPFIPLPPPLPLPPVFNIPPICSGRLSCSRRCEENGTSWRAEETLSCYCDTACYEVFNDCCTDYVKYCGAQKPNEISVKTFNWTCEHLGNLPSTGFCEIGDGVWMVARCAHDWPDDEIRSKCEDPTKVLTSADDISRYIPAMSENVTFRNYFCAKCNRAADSLEFWPVEIKANVIPPEHYNFIEKVNFLLLNGAEFPQNGPTRPQPTQARRYCLNSDIVDSCPENVTSNSCTNGPVALVSSLSGKQSRFRNFDCALCNDPQGLHQCFPTTFNFRCRATQPQRFMVYLSYKKTSEEESIFTISSETCERIGLKYDNKLQECVEDFSFPTGSKDEFRILSWFSPSKDFRFTDEEFKTIIKQYFGVDNSQIVNVTLETVHLFFPLDPTPASSILYHLVSSTILLTPQQSFDVLFKIDSNFESTALNLRSFVNFEKPLKVTLNNITYTIIKTTSRPFSCSTQKVYAPQEYEDLPNERVRIWLTNKAYSFQNYEKSEYFGKINENITICERYSPSKCEMSQTGLAINDFDINANLSLYHKDTGMLYDFGQYNVVNNSISLCVLPGTCASEKSCAGRCSNRTEWRTEVKVRCFCDPNCYEVFNDCCADYTKYCGTQIPTETATKKYNHTCLSVGHYDTKRCAVGDGLWMVARCPPEWPHDNLRTKCEQPLDKLTISSPDLDRYLPVLGRDNNTFRNMYCAVCNGVEKYEPWLVEIDTVVIPPENYDFTDKIRFLLAHGARFPEGEGPWRPVAHQARRYCLKEIVDSCPLGEVSDSCTNGTVAVVSAGRAHFKNKHCATCNGLPSEHYLCFPAELPPSCRMFFPYSFSLVLDPNSRTEIQFQTRTLVQDEKCGQSGMIFDDILQVCRVSWLSPPEKNAQERFHVLAWLEPPQSSPKHNFTTAEFQDSLANHLNISRLQLSHVNTTTVLLPGTNILLFYIVSSTIVLEAEQSFELLTANSTQPLRNFIYFSEPFALQIKGVSYNVAKTTSRPLACVGQVTYRPEQYVLLDGETVFVPSTNTSYEKFEYFRENVEQLAIERGNITVCEKFSKVGCNGTLALYAPEEYVVMVNLSIFVPETSSLYHYGEYDVFSNKSVTVCQSVRVRILRGAGQTVRDNVALGYVTFIFFMLSILFLIFLLVTYIIFPQLRTLPGKNLMNLAASLLLFNVFWLPPSDTDVRSDKPSCMALAIIEHYFLMASFVSMSVIAFHTCKVFARNLPAPKMSTGHERKLFCIYLALVWLVPAIFVAICVVLDDQDVVKVGYGESEICWLTENNAYSYFVTIPIAILLLFNMMAFGITAVFLRQHRQNQDALRATGNRASNLSVYVKLSSLMGFTWLFGLLALVVTSTTVFWYLFVISTSLQGVFVAVAFVVNAKTLNLYRQGYKKYHSSSTPNTTSRKLTTDIHHNTKL